MFTILLAFLFTNQKLSIAARIVTLLFVVHFKGKTVVVILARIEKSGIYEFSISFKKEPFFEYNIFKNYRKNILFEMKFHSY